MILVPTYSVCECFLSIFYVWVCFLSIFYMWVCFLSIFYVRICFLSIFQVGKKGGKTLVHCVAGVSRSATICLAYLVKYQQMTLEQAYRHVKKRRSVIHPNAGFWRQLIDYERRILGQNSVKMITSPIGWIPDVYLEETKNMLGLGDRFRWPLVLP